MLRFVRLWMVFLGLVVLYGCSTPYKEYSWLTGAGYKDTMLTKDTAVITFKSNSDYSDADTAVIAGVMRRAAELTLEQGYSGFMVLKDGGQSSQGAVSTGGTFNAFSAGGMTTGTYSPTMLFWEDNSYRATIKMVNSTGDTVFVASEVMETTAAQFNR